MSGLRKAARGPFRQIAESCRVPLLDVGTIRDVRRGRISAAGGIESMLREIGIEARRIASRIAGASDVPSIPTKAATDAIEAPPGDRAGGPE